MKVLFAVSNDNITTSVVSKYQQTYKEIITSKNVYYFNAIIKELQNDKTYDAIVIGEDLEPVANNNYEAIDKFLIEKLDRISDEASKPTGEDIPIIFICAERRTKSSQLLLRLFSMSIYDALVGNDRSVNKVCALINKPRSKKEAKRYYQIETDQAEYEAESEELVSEDQIQNILNYYKKIGSNEKKCVDAFDSIAKQYDDTQLRIIVKFLPMSVKAILEINSQRYQQLMTGGTVLSNGKYNKYKTESAKNQGRLEFLEKDLEKTKLSEPVVIPETMNLSSNAVNVNNYSNTNNNYSNNMQNTQRTIINQNQQNNMTPNMKPQTNNQVYGNYNNYMNNNNNLYNNKGYYNLYNQQKTQNPQQQANTQYNSQYNQQEKQTYNPNYNQYKSQENVQQANSVGIENNNIAPNISSDTVNSTYNIEPEVLNNPTIDSGSGLIESTVTPPTTVSENNSIMAVQPVAVEPVKRGRGRPRKTPLLSEDAVPKVKRGRGRPRKTPLTPEENINATSEAIGVFNNNSNILPEIESKIETIQEAENSNVEATVLEDAKTNSNENILPRLEQTTTTNDTLPGVEAITTTEDTLPGIEEITTTEDILPEIEEINTTEDILPGIEAISDNEKILPGVENDNENMLSGIEENNTTDSTLPKVDEINKNTEESNNDSESEDGENDMNNFNQNPYGGRNPQNPYGNGISNNQQFYKMNNNFNQNNPYGNNSQNPYGNVNGYNPQNPYGNGMGYNPQNPYGNGMGYNPQNPYGNGMGYNPQNPYGNVNGYNPQNPYGNGMGYNPQNPYDNGMNTSNPYGTEPANTFGNEQVNNTKEQLGTNNQNIIDNNPNINITNDLVDNVEPTAKEPAGLVAKNGKVALFIGTTKNGTSFIVNNLSSILSNSGINTAIVDLTKNRNAYYMFTDNKADLMQLAANSLKSLQSGEPKGIEVNKNLTVFTGLPDDNTEEINPNEIIKNVSSKYDVILLDCDFDTDAEYYRLANEIYLVQSMDAFTIQPLTKLLSDLKNNNMLDESKLRVIINKYVKTNKLDTKMIVGGMSKYNEPSMTLQRDIFNPDNIKPVVVSFEEQNYVKYIEDIAMCHLSLNGYTKNLIQSLEELKNMVYPLIAGNNGGNTPNNYSTENKKRRGLFGLNKKEEATFSNDMNNTLNKMRTNY